MNIKYPEIEVELAGTNGNAWAVVGKVKRALRRAGVSVDECAEFQKEALSDDYDHVLQTCMGWVSVE
jgi:hypothetical protein